MNLNPDFGIFAGFLIISLVIGIFSGRNVKSLDQYAIGDRNFSTATIAATIVATWIAASFFTFNLSMAYSDGISFITAVIGNGISLFIIGYFYGPRMGEFLGNRSIAESIGGIYGNRVRLITAVCSIFLSAGYIALQIKVLSSIMGWSSGLEPMTATIISSTIVILYSSFGGIRSVAFTDIFQFLTFGTFIPGLAILLWGVVGEPSKLLEVVSTSPKFELNNLFSFSWLFLVFWLTIPSIDPLLFQRVLMSKNIPQLKRAFLYASIACVFLILITSWIGVLAFTINQSITPDNILIYILDNYSYVGLKGFTLAGVAAMVMSTVDSDINSSSVTFTNDFCRMLGIRPKNELLVTRVFAVCIGLFGLIVSLSFNNLFELTLMVTNFYMPVVTVPMTLAIFGFRSTEKSVLIGMGAGIITVFLWRIFLMDTGIDSVIPAMFANLTFLIGSHYILNQKGGWVGVKDKQPLEQIKEYKRMKNQILIKKLKEFAFLDFLRDHAPTKDSVYTTFGLFSIVSIFSSIYMIPSDTALRFKEIIDFFGHSVLVLSTLFLTKPIWPGSINSRSISSILWFTGTTYMLFFVGVTLAIISKFHEFNSLVFVLNFILFGMIVRWYVSLIFISIGIVASVYFVNFSLHLNVLEDFGNFEYKLVYISLALAGTLIAFIKPKQEEYHVIDVLNKQLESQVHDREVEMMKAFELKHEFVRNINHEIRTPMMGVTSFAVEFNQMWDTLSEEKRKKGVKMIAQNADRLLAYMKNLLDFSALTSNQFAIDEDPVDFTELLRERVYECLRMSFIENKDQEVKFEIEEKLSIRGDKYYLAQLIDNLIINAIKYGNGKLIEIKSKRVNAENGKKAVKIIIKDRGIGIAEEEYDEIFNPFYVGSRTKSTAGGRGIGLALCKKISDSHEGTISVSPNANGGSIFTVIIPTGE
jgi:Na+/proline symporter/signal transduction histidine kinase